MPEKGYESISLPTPLLDEVRAFLLEHPGLGFSSMADFIKAAVRHQLDRASRSSAVPDRFVDVDRELRRENLEGLLRAIIRSEIQGVPVRSVVIHKDQEEPRPPPPPKKASRGRRKP